MTAIAAPASVLPSAPAPVGGYDKDAAEGFGALLAQTSANASNDKASPRDAGKAADKAADRAADRAQDNSKASSAKAAERAADAKANAKADRAADASDKTADAKPPAKVADAAQTSDKASDAPAADSKTDAKDNVDTTVAADGQTTDATAAQTDAAALAAAALIAAMQAPTVETPKTVAADQAATATAAQTVATAAAAPVVAQAAQAQAPAVPAAALATDAAATAPALDLPETPAVSAAELAAAAAAAAKTKTASAAPAAKTDAATPAPAASTTAPTDAAAAALVAAAAPATDAEPAPAPVQTAAAAQAAAPEVASVTGKVVKTAEPKTASTTATAVAAAVADASAEPAHGQVAPAAHAATTGEGGTDSGAQDHANAQGSALKDAAPVVAAADASPTAPTFVAPGTAAAPAPVVAAQLPKAGPETVSHLTTEIASKAVVGKTSRFDVVLQPEGLGRVDVRIEIAKDGKLTAALNFDNPAAAADMRGKSGELRQALAAAGFNVADNALSFDSSSQNNGGQSQNAFFDFQNQQGGDNRQAFHGRAFQSTLGEDIPLAPSALLPGLRVAEASGVDVENLGEIAMVTATGSTGNATLDKINNSRSSLADNEQTFLKLLTTQLKNQDPLSPTDTTQMTSQITQMTGVEQQLVTNDLLTALVGMSTGGGISEGVNLMGKQVTAETDKSVLKDKEASWSYTQSRAGTGVKIEVLDKFDKVVATVLPDDMSGGDHTFKWDGKSTPEGVQQPEGGEYTIKVTATDANGTDIPTTAKGRIDGIVTKVTNEAGVNMVWIGDTKVPLDSVIGVTNVAADPSKDDTDTTTT